MYVVDNNGEYTVAYDYSYLQEALNSMVHEHGHAVLDEVDVFRVDTENPVKLEVYISVVDENESELDDSDYDSYEDDDGELD
jgi:hypothetical protein